MAVKLKISLDTYEKQISVLEDKMRQMDETITAYEVKKLELPEIMDGEDSNYEKTLDMINDNIARVKTARAHCDASLEILRGERDKMIEYNRVAEEKLEAGKENANRIADEAFNAMKLLS